ncbi:EF-P beta-lysylation protein EpmB [Moraxella catarrhalis]|uniref:L-lysine 2,3-aminomutase n=1 Tax=Moraxella catarrhalis TaxID=480 RepID=A0A198UQ05_MORCA|nr:EF-P beta-lysylation protein EpmB [Moraxella catarrhalis]OAU97065.1 Lysyl-lysine 2,3-aminomutase [Moraxella catarrhalis]OAU98436.1 Lysyl-lysine 2,3-aminomutase [Moraxella catarrhalis]OAV00182.1 Lysyl-lysine 2,3-aminomutase [Moraxella catarrhalis]
MISTKKIYHSASSDDFQDWQAELSGAVSDLDTLFTLLDLPKQAQIHTPKQFGLRVPHAFIKKMKKGDINDPLLRQVLPDTKETWTIGGYSTDPLDENNHNPIKGLLHKYQSRVLLTVTGACAVHCRYCFRQHFDYHANQPSTHEMDAVMDYITKHTEVDEVILSGGDPLSLSNKRLKLWLDKIGDIAHIRTVRLHTRLPVVLPNRVDDELITLIRHYQKNIVIVLHINHPNEIDEQLIAKSKQLKDAGVTLLNQSVLLADINDDIHTLSKLSQDLFGAGILPYYLHILDKVQGAAHFDIAISDAIQLYWQLLEVLPGYLVPKLVQELPNRPFKTPIDIYQHSNEKN